MSPPPPASKMMVQDKNKYDEIDDDELGGFGFDDGPTTYSTADLNTASKNRAKASTLDPPNDPPKEQTDAATKLQSMQRGKLARKELDEKNQAATKLQTIQRGKSARKELDDKNQAATKLQTIQRGNSVRKELEDTKPKHHLHHHHDPDTQEIILGTHPNEHHKHRHDPETGKIVIGEHVHHHHHNGQVILGKQHQHLDSST